MSYDLSAFWNGYVVAIVICSILGCALLLFVQSKATFTENQETGHKWDETLQEYNNPMPKWWMWLFTLTIIFGLVYLTLYPGLGNYAGQLGWTSAKQLEKEIADTDAKIKPMFENRYQRISQKFSSYGNRQTFVPNILYAMSRSKCHRNQRFSKLG